MKLKFRIIPVLLLFFVACSDEGNDLYQAAKNMNTASAYGVYLKKYPQGLRADEIKDSLKSCIEKDKFEEVKRINTIGAYISYINSVNPERFKQQAKDSVNSISESDCFRKGKKESDLYSLNLIVKNYPEGKYYQRAIYLIDSIKISEKENKFVPDFDKSQGIFTDQRDEVRYKWIRLGEQVWMAENLNYKTPEGSTAYNNDPLNQTIFGLLYNWETANNVCPDGWHLPSDKEWDELENFLGGKGIASTQLKAESSLWENSESQYIKSCGFNALPGGDLDAFQNQFGNIGKFANFWTSTLDKNNNNAIYRFMKNDQTIVFRVHYDIKNYNSVRCIKD